MSRLTRSACAFALLALLAGCDANEDRDLYLLDPIQLDAYVEVPEGGTATRRLVLTLPVRFEVEIDQLSPERLHTVTASSGQSLTDALAAAGYSWAAVRTTDVRASGFFRLEEPSGATFDFLQLLRLDLEVGGEVSRIVDSYYPNGNRYDIYSLYFQQGAAEALRTGPIQARLALQPRSEAEIPASGVYTFELQLRFELEVGTAAPAADGLVITRDLRVRDELRYRGVDVADVESARIGEVRLRVGPAGIPAGTAAFEERFEGIAVRLALPGGEGEAIARLDRFERNAATGEVTAVARPNVNVSRLVRRSSELEMQIEFDLDDTAAVQGEYYFIGISAELIVEVPIDALQSTPPVWP